jgi:phospholipid/cholesterol/gamma-HCH transport system ATP-binding protein
MIVTHDIEGGLLICDRVAMLANGTLKFCGTPGEFRNSADPVVRSFADRAGAEAALDQQLNLV